MARESLNTLILNLYPDKNEYSFALRMGSIVDDLNVGNNLDKTTNVSTHFIFIFRTKNAHTWTYIVPKIFLLTNIEYTSDY